LCVAVDGIGAALTSTNPTGGGVAWTVAPVDGTNIVHGASCPSASLCVAVDGSGNVVWSTTPGGPSAAWTAANVDGGHTLEAVSCTSAPLCVAVDNAGNVLTSTNPAGGTWTPTHVDGSATLQSVFCNSAPLCVAVDNAGNVLTSTNPTAGAWQVTNVDGANIIYGVACTAASTCVAADDVGNVITSTNPTAGSWTVANVDGARQFSGISCGGALCAAVDTAGNVVTSTNPTGGQAAWTVTPFDVGNVPSAISCPQSTYCAAVDASGNVVESTNPAGGPSSWQSTKADAATPLFGVTCASLSFCLVVDSVSSAVVGTPIALPVTLTVNLTPAGSGSVAGTGIDCPHATCSNTYEAGTVVTLTATPNPGFAFTGWSGGGCSGTGTCVLILGSSKAVTATFVPTHVLTVSVAGAGSGGVKSDSGGIDCPGVQCTAAFNQGTTVTLTATAANGSVFTGWSGAGCSGTSTCVVTMSADRAVTATFVPTHVLTVSLASAGAGSVAASGINCPGVCSDAYPQGTVVSLSATPSSGSVFAGWSGACSGTGACVVTMNSDQGVTATFAPAPAVTPPAVGPASAGSTGVPPLGSVAPSSPCTLAVKGSKVRLPAPNRHDATQARASVGTVTLTARCNQTAALVLTGSIRVLPGAHPRARGKTFRLTALRATAHANATVTLVVKLPKAALQALGAGRRESARFQLAVTDANGTNTATTRVRRLSAMPPSVSKTPRTRSVMRARLLPVAP
jgi:hypothetical protein